MKFKVAVSNLWIGKTKYKRGDIVDLSDDEARLHGVRLEPVVDTFVEPPKEPKPKRKRRTKAEMEAAKKEAAGEEE